MHSFFGHGYVDREGNAIEGKDIGGDITTEIRDKLIEYKNSAAETLFGKKSESEIMPDEISESQKNQLPADFDVVIFQGEPQEENSFNAYSMSLYVVGGCAKPVELEKKSSFGR